MRTCSCNVRRWVTQTDEERKNGIQRQECLVCGRVHHNPGVVDFETTITEQHPLIRK